jgi:hypothetical protein
MLLPLQILNLLAPVDGTDALSAEDVESASEVSSPALTQTHVLTAVSVESASEVSSPALGVVGVVAKQKGGGGVRKLLYIVEVDGEKISVESIAAAESILLQARQIAKQSAAQDVLTPTTPKPPRVSVKTAAGNVTTSKVLQREVKRTQAVINQAYIRRAKEIEQDIEISQLMLKKIQQEERDDESAIMALLLT